MRPVKALLNEQHAAPDVERFRRSHHEAIAELQAIARTAPTIVPNVTLVDAVPATIAHKLGRRPVFVQVSVTRGAGAPGYINETLSQRTDKVIVLEANDYGATITVDVQVS